MKTIVARFTEMKKAPGEIIEVDGEEVNVNKVEAALKSVGVQLRDTQGQFRDLDDVFLELSSKWDSLDVMSQRYVATMAAGSRQQSRFIAMMSNYQRTMELTGYATNSAGASQKQFEKTMDSLESKVNKLRDAWEQFVTGIANQSIIKDIVDLLKDLISTVNVLTDALDPLHLGWSKIMAAFLAFKGAKNIMNKGLQYVGTQLGTRGQPGRQTGFDEKKGAEDGTKYANGFWIGFKKIISDKKAANVVITPDQREKTKQQLTNRGMSTYTFNKTGKDTSAAQILKTESSALETQSKELDKLSASYRNYSTVLKDTDTTTTQWKTNVTKAINRTRDAEIAYQRTLDRSTESGKTAYLASRERMTKLEQERDVLRDTTAAQNLKNEKTEQEVICTYNNTTATELNTQSKELNTQSEELNTSSSILSGNAKVTEAGATNKATVAQEGFNAAVKKFPLMWIIMAIGAAIKAIKSLIDWMGSADSETEKRKKAEEETANSLKYLDQQISQTKSNVEDLKSSWEKLQGLKSELGQLTIGTTQWKQKVFELNQQVLELVNKYPLLSKYMHNNNGVLSIDSTGYEKLLEEQTKGLQSQQLAQAFTTAKKRKQEISDIDRNMETEYNSDTNFGRLMGSLGIYKHRSFTKTQVEEANLNKSAKQMEVDSNLSIGVSAIVDKYVSDQKEVGNLISDEKAQLAKTALVNEQTYDNFNKIKDKTEANVSTYARLTGLTEDEVKQKKENKEINDDLIRTTIAADKFQDQYGKQIESLINLNDKNLSETALRSIQGTNTFSQKDLNGYLSGTFDKYIKNGRVNLDDLNGYEISNIKKELGDLGISEVDIATMQNAGVTLQQIVQNVVNSDASLQQLNTHLLYFDETTKGLYNSLTTGLEDRLGKELSTAQEEKIAGIFSKVKGQGGDVENFSKYLNEIMGQFETPKEIEDFLNNLQNADFSSASSIRSFLDQLETINPDKIKFGEDIRDELSTAANAAQDFDLSKVREEIDKTAAELTGDIVERKDSNNKEFTEDNMKKFKQQLTEAGKSDLANKFIKRLDKWVYTGSLDELQDALNITSKYADAVKKVEQDKTNVAVKNQKRDKFVANNQLTELEADQTAWEYLRESGDQLADFVVDNASNSKIDEMMDLSSKTGKQENYLNSLLYKYNSEGKQLDEFDTEKIGKILKRAREDSKFAETLPIEFITKAFEHLEDLKNSGNTKKYNDFSEALSVATGNTYQGSSAAEHFDEWKNFYAEMYQGGRAGFGGPAKSWHGGTGEDQLKINRDYLQQFVNEKLITEEIAEQWVTLPVEEILEKTKNLKFDTDSKLQEEANKYAEDIYELMDSAKEIVALQPLNEQMAKSQEDALDGLINTHKGYELRLKQLEKQYNLTSLAAKQYLAIQYEQEDATDDILSTLSDYKDVISDDKVSTTKGTQDYYAAIETLTTKFKTLFGDNITSEWVEKNLSTINKLSKGGKEAQDAMDALAATSEAVLPSFYQKNSGNANGKIDETIFSKISSNIKDATSDISTSKEQMVKDFNNIKGALNKLNGSDATIEIKENTRAKTMEAVKNAAIGLTAQIALVSDPAEAQAIRSKISIIKSLASSVGFALTIPDMPTAQDITNQISQWKQRGLSEKEARAVISSSIQSGITIKDIQGTSIAVDKVNAEGTGEKTNGLESDSSSSKKNNTSTWTNDWDRQYDTLKKIESLERKRNELDKQHQRYVKSNLLNEKQILKTKEDQRRNLMQQMQLNEKLVQDADAWLRGMNSDGKFDGAIWWDDNTKTIRTNDAYIRSMDEDTKKEFDTVKSDYEHYYSQRNTALDNLDTIADTLSDLDNSITELDYHNTTERLIKVIDNVINLYDKAETRLEWTERNVTSQDVKNLYDAKGKELVEKSKVLTSDFIQTEAEINALLNKPDYKKYYTYDWKTGAVTTTKAYDALVDKDIKDKVKDFISKLETLSEQRNSDDSERIDIQDTLREMEKALLDKAESFRQNVYDAIVQQKEDEISKLETINSSVQEAAANLVSSIQKNIQKIRQDRTNQKTEEELTKLQNRLTYLQMDTSGGNQKEILDLQKQLDDKEQSYTDSLIDQKISELQDQNTEAEKQRKKQIEIMKTQLEVQKDNGLIWNDVRYMIANGLSNSGKIKKDSELDRALKQWGKYSSLSEQGQKSWMHEQDLGASNFDAYYNQGLNARDYDQQVDYTADGGNIEYDIMKANMINAYKQGLIESINNTTPYRDYMKYDANSNKLIQTQLFPHPDTNKALNTTLDNAWKTAWDTINTINNIDSYFNGNKKKLFSHIPDYAKYANGGLADFTGPAWLDGTKSSPELVLNAEDTKNFIQLKDILSNIMTGEVKKATSIGDYYFEIQINVDKVTSDYDVDKMVDRIKQQITNSAGYRNVNTINMIR